MNLEDVINSEATVTSTSITEFPQSTVDCLDLIHLLLKASHFLNEQTHPDSPDGFFHFTAFSTYAGLPYTLKAVYDLWLKGYYLEASIINRHIIEGFAKLRYFHNHREKVDGHLKGTNRVSFKRMFDVCAPNYYRRYYGKIHSDIAHGGVKAFGFRAEYTSPTVGRIVQGCEFNSRWAGMVLSQPLQFGYGYLNYLDVFFPSVLSKFDSATQQERESLLSRLKGYINSIPDSDYKPIVLQFLEK